MGKKAVNPVARSIARRLPVQRRAIAARRRGREGAEDGLGQPNRRERPAAHLQAGGQEQHVQRRRVPLVPLSRSVGEALAGQQGSGAPEEGALIAVALQIRHQDGQDPLQEQGSGQDDEEGPIVPHVRSGLGHRRRIGPEAGFGRPRKRPSVGRARRRRPPVSLFRSSPEPPRAPIPGDLPSLAGIFMKNGAPGWTREPRLASLPHNGNRNRPMPGRPARGGAPGSEPRLTWFVSRC